jgi:NADPH2:quinone reductase
MRAIVIKGFGGLDSLVIETLPDPEPKAGHAVIEVKAFGINHAETHMRKGEWAEAAPVSGIECVGVVKACPGGEFAPGTKVVAFMGGLGRTINGSYAELTNPPVANIIPISTDMPWEDLAVIPESYATAWTCLLRNLEIKKGQMLVIRGATSALGRAALNIAHDVGATIIATTRKKARMPLTAAPVSLQENKLLLIFLDRGHRCCRNNVFNPLLQMPSGVHFTFFGSFVFGTPQFPVSDIPMQDIVEKAAAGVFKAKPAKVFRFDDIRDAHEAMESNQSNGKMVVLV